MDFKPPKILQNLNSILVQILEMHEDSLKNALKNNKIMRFQGHLSWSYRKLERVLNNRLGLKTDPNSFKI